MFLKLCLKMKCLIQVCLKMSLIQSARFLNKKRVRFKACSLLAQIIYLFLFESRQVACQLKRRQLLCKMLETLLQNNNLKWQLTAQQLPVVLLLAAQYGWYTTNSKLNDKYSQMNGLLRKRRSLRSLREDRRSAELQNEKERVLNYELRIDNNNVTLSQENNRL